MSVSWSKATSAAEVFLSVSRILDNIYISQMYTRRFKVHQYPEERGQFDFRLSVIKL